MMEKEKSKKEESGGGAERSGLVVGGTWPCSSGFGTAKVKPCRAYVCLCACVCRSNTASKVGNCLSLIHRSVE